MSLTKKDTRGSSISKKIFNEWQDVSDWAFLMKLKRGKRGKLLSKYFFVDR